MTRPSDDFPGEEQQNEDVAPELHNSEQDDEQSQAHALAGERLAEGGDDLGLENSEKVATGEEGDDVQDIVDHMRQMVSSGRIDNSAYNGEPNHDDEDELYEPAVGSDKYAAGDPDAE